MDSSRESEAADLAAAIRGDHAAFSRLVRRHHAAVVRVGTFFFGDAHDAHEVAQETLLKAYLALPRFRHDASFRTWLLRIALNTARSLRARRRRKKRAARVLSLSVTGPDGGSGVDLPSTAPGPQDDALRRELREVLSRAIVRLGPESREVILERDVRGRSYTDISERLGLPVGTVKSKIHRARLELRRAVSSYL